MKTATLPALLSMPFRPIRLALIEWRLRSSEMEVDVIRWQQKMLRDEERREHEKQVRLASKRAQLERQ